MLDTIHNLGVVIREVKQGRYMSVYCVGLPVYKILPGETRYECSQMLLFRISGNNPKFSYDLWKFYDFQCKIAMFTNTSNENDTSWIGSWIHAKKPEQECVVFVQGMLTKEDFWAPPWGMSHQSNFHFRKPSFSSIQLLLSLRLCHQSRLFPDSWRFIYYSLG